MANYPVSIVYDDGSDVQEGNFNLTAILLSKLEVTMNPTKMTYRIGETMDYTGMVITATYDDDTTSVVTNNCVITPAAGEAFESPVEIVYAEGQDEKNCSLALTEITLQRIYIASHPAKTTYKAGDNIDYTGLSVKAVYSDESEVDITGRCSFSTEEGTAFNPDDDTSVEISYLDCSIFLNLTAITLTGIAITSNPTKTAYRSGEAIDYTGLVVSASYSDGSTEIVTSSCTITPRAGKAFAPETDTSVEISYSEIAGDSTIATTLTLTEIPDIYLTGISVTANPTKTAYKSGQIIDYTGMVVTASYSDGSTADVTSSCTITPAAGKSFDPETDTDVEISYSEGGEQATASLILSEISLTGLQVTANPHKTAYKHGERISYTGMVVTASYSDGSSFDVTSECSITPKSNKKFDADTDTYVEITYSDMSCMLTLTPVIPTVLQVTTRPNKATYSAGEIINYSGIVVTVIYSDNSTDNVTAKCSFSPAAGKSFDPDTDSTCTITYTEDNNELTCTLSLTGAMTLRIDTLPIRTIYVDGEAVNYSGAVVKAVHADGTEHTVTDYCTYTPLVNGEQATVTVSCAVPAEPYVFDQNSGYITNGAWVPESPTNTYIDIYEVTAGHRYLLALGSDVGSRFRAMFTTTDVSKASARVTGINIINTDNPAAYASVEYTPTSDGYIAVGKDNVGKSDVKTYLYDANASEKTATATFTLRVVEAEYSLIIDTPPEQTHYEDGDTISYSGIIVKSVHVDGDASDVTQICEFTPADETTINSDTTVTVKCASPIEPYAFDINGYYHDDDKGIWWGVDDDYEANYRSDVYRVTQDHSYLITLGSTVGDTFVARYYPYDFIAKKYLGPSSYPGNSPRSIVGLSDFNGDTIKASTQAVYKAPYDGLIAVIKDQSGTSGIKSYLYDADSSEKTLKTTFTLAVGGIPEFITVTAPIKARYRVGETYDYTGAIVTAHYAGGHIENVTEKAVFSPANGATVTSDNPEVQTNTSVTVSYLGKQASFDLTVGGVDIVSLSITPPNKTLYWVGDTIDYTGCRVIAEYWDGSTKDVTNEAVFEPADGSTVRYGIDENNNLAVSVSYQELDATLASNVRSEYADWQEVGTTYLDDWDDYETLSTASITTYELKYFDVTSGNNDTLTYSLYNTEHPYSSIAGHIISPEKVRHTQERIDADNADYMARGFTFREYLTSCPCIREYDNGIKGRQFGYWRDTYTAIFENDNAGVIYPVTEGLVGFLPVSSAFIPLLQISYGSEASSSFKLSVITLQSLLCSPSIKTTYHYGEAIDYTGYTFTAVYSNGDTVDVSSLVDFYPDQGYKLTYSRDGRVAYSHEGEYEAYRFRITVIKLSNITVTPPSKTTYQIGEAIDYSGAVVTATYSDGSTEIVTSSAVFSPAAGTTITSDTTVSVSYTNAWSETATANFSLTVSTENQ